jgi:hypothetical protein
MPMRTFEKQVDRQWFDASSGDYLRRKTESAIDTRYRKGYADGTALGPDFDGWEEEGAWPTE